MLDNFLTEPQCEDFEEEDLSWEGVSQVMMLLEN